MKYFQIVPSLMIIFGGIGLLIVDIHENRFWEFSALIIISGCAIFVLNFKRMRL